MLLKQTNDSAAAIFSSHNFNNNAAGQEISLELVFLNPLLKRMFKQKVEPQLQTTFLLGHFISKLKLNGSFSTCKMEGENSSSTLTNRHQFHFIFIDHSENY